MQFDVVEQNHGCPFAKVVQSVVPRRGCARCRTDALEEGVGDQLRIGQVGQINDPNAVGPVGHGLQPNLQGKASLAHLTWTGDRNDSTGCDEADD